MNLYVVYQLPQGNEIQDRLILFVHVYNSEENDWLRKMNIKNNTILLYFQF